MRPEVRTLSRNRQRLIVQLLSLVLLLAQLGMQAHAYSHLGAEKHGVPATVQYCGDCVSFAPLLGMGGSASTTCLAHHVPDAYVSPVSTTSAADSLPTAAFRSRAPPQIL